MQLGFGAAVWAAGALPQGATVVNGQVGITQNGANSLQIQASGGSIVNWQQFSIGTGNQVRITLPNSSSAMLNRVIGVDSSQLLGSLQSNGRIFLINPNGIVVGSGARIDASSFIASTLDMADGDFLAGKLRFMAKAGAGAIRNDGVITAGPGGRVALIAPDIQNTGIIQAADGQILLAAGRKLEISSLDFEGVTFEIQAPTDAVLNLGKLLAENGAVSVFAGTLRHSGEIRANRMVQDADGSIRLVASNALAVDSGSITTADGLAGGSIRIQTTGGTTHVAGSVSAQGSEGQGGSIQILGDRVALDAGARVDASGAHGGGEVLVGGDFQGRNAAIQNAQRVYVDADTNLRADATQSGDGGKVVVWADGNTQYLGSLSARGVGGGSGGHAEVSGKQNLAFAGSADLGSDTGHSGTLLLDPLDILVSSTGGILTSVVDQFSDFPGNVVTISPTTLNNVKGNVTLQAERDIYFNSPVALTTAGAGLSATAGGTNYNAQGGGQIYLNQNISTTGGAVTLHAVGVSGGGAISTAGGAVEIKTSGNETYSGAIASGGGAVSLESKTGYVSGANVDAGSGAISVTAATTIYGGAYSSTGNVSLATAAGTISGGTVTGATVTLSATGGSVSAVNVAASTRVDATSSNSSIYLLNYASQPLRVGTLSAPSTISLSSSNGFAQAAGGSITGPSVYISSAFSTAQTGTLAAPLVIRSPQLTVQNLAADAHIQFAGNPTLTALTLQGSLAALSTSTIGGAANLGTLSLGNSGGNLSVSADSGAVSGFGSGFVVQVSDAGITAPTLNLLGGNVTLSSAGSLSIGTLNAASLYATALGAVSLGSITTTGSSGIYVATNACTASYVGCAASSPIAATTLTAGGSGTVQLRTYDNGDITISGSLSAASATLMAGSTYYTSAYPYYYTMRTANNINVASATLSGALTVTDNGGGNITLGSLTAGGSVNISAGGSYKAVSGSYPYYQNLTTSNAINVTVVEPSTPTGSFQITDNGTGNINLTGAVNRPSGNISLSASNGNVTAANDLSAYGSVNVSASGASSAATLANVTTSNGSVSLSAAGNLTVDQVSAGSLTSTSNSGATLNAGGDVSFLSISSFALPSYAQSYGYGSVSISSSQGSIKTRLDNTAADISSNANVTLSANNLSNGVIGNASFTNPLDIVSGLLTSNSITLSAGKDIGAPGKTVNADTLGTLSVTSLGGRFFVAAQTGDGVTQQSLDTIRLSASAAGMGASGTSSLSSLDLNVNATSDGSTITLGDVVRSTGSLNAFRFTATNGGLTIGNINLSTAGYNQLYLNASGALTQSSPVTTNNIAAGYIYLNASGNPMTLGNVSASTLTAGNMVDLYGGDITTGALSGPGVQVTGANLNLASVTSSGTNRGYYSAYYYVPRLGYYTYVTDETRLTASGTLSTSGNISSQTSAIVSANGLSVNAGSGTVSGGHTYTGYYADTINLNSGTGALSVANVSSYNVTAQGSSLTMGAVTANSTLNLGSASTTALTTGALTGPGSITLNAGSFSTGNITTAGGLNLTANASGAQTYVPGAISIAAGYATVNAANGMDLSAATFTAPTVTLNATAGDITASLTGTTNLTLNTGGHFTVSSLSALTSLNVTADGSVAGAGGGSSVTDSTNQVMKVQGPVSALALTLKPSAAGLSEHYVETGASVTDMTVSTSGTLLSGSSINVSAPSANITTSSVTLASGSLTLSTDGDINLTSAATGGGAVNVYSGSGTVNLTSVSTAGGSVTARTSGDATKNVNVVSVNSLGGSVYLTADNGSITGTGALAIDMRNGAGAASGTLTLLAEQGSIGSGATPLLTSGAVTLDARSKDDLVVDVANTALTNLYVTTQASGAGTVQVTNSNYSGLTMARVAGTDLNLSGLNPTATGAFSLSARDGNIHVTGDIGNVTNLTLDAQNGDLTVAASGGVARSVVSSSSMSLQAGRDIILSAGTNAAESVSVQSGYSMTVQAGRDVQVLGSGGSAALTQAGPYYASQSVYAGRDIVVSGGTAGNATALLQSTLGSQYLNAGGNIQIQGGTGTGAYAGVLAGQSQSVYTNNLSVQGGSDGAYAALQGASQSVDHIYGTAQVLGGSGIGAYAEVVSTAGSQSFGNQSSYYYANVTDGITVQGGAGSGAYASVRSATSQEVHSAGDIQVLAGSGANANAELKATTSQNVGGTSTYYYNYPSNTATNNVLVQASATGTARILAGGNQTVYAGGAITVAAGSGANMTASIETTAGAQTIGNNSISSNDATGNITVAGGSGTGAAAWIRSTSNQTVMPGGTLTVTGGTGTNASAFIESSAGSQNIGNTYIYSYDAGDGITVQAGSGSGAAAWIKAATGQTIDTGGAISVTGAGAYAEIVSTTGSQTLGNRQTYSGYAPTTTISVTGGNVANAYARVAALAGSQTVQSAGGIQLTGGTGDGADAVLLAATGQSVGTSGALTITGGTATTSAGNESGLRNTLSGAQSVQSDVGIALNGGGLSSNTWIRQAGTGAQTISTSGALQLLASTAGAERVSIDAGLGGQSVVAGGAVTLSNAGAHEMQLYSGAAQTLSAQSLSILLNSTTGTNPLAAMTSTTDQTIVLNGVDSNNPATLTVSNLSASSGSKALLQSGGNQTITMNYLAAGLMQVGNQNAQGISNVYASGDQTIVAGELLVQGGSSAAAVSTVSDGTSTSGTMLVSTLNGKVNVQAGSAGAAQLDPLNLSVVSNGSIQVTSGSASTASAAVTAGIINMTATNGNMLVVSNGAPATVTASTTSTASGANTFNLNASGGLTVSGGATITASAGGSVLLGASCVGCSTGLVGPFNVTVPPVVTTPTGTTAGASDGLSSLSNSLYLWTSDFASLDQSLADLIAAGYDLVVAEDGTVTSRRRNLAQCY